MLARYFTTFFIVGLTTACFAADEHRAPATPPSESKLPTESGEVKQLKGLVKELTDRIERKEKGTKTAEHGDQLATPPALTAIVNNLRDDNAAFVRSHDSRYIKPFMDSQSPRATVVTCADSRVHEHALDKTPDGDLFMVRNIGNQLATAEGSIEYGVQHLKTPLLIFVGHTVCGAIKAALGDYKELSSPIRKELDTMKIAKGNDVMAGVLSNVNNQVAAAMKKFAHETASGELTVLGAVYDFRNDLNQGSGRLVIVNVQGDSGSGKSARLQAITKSADKKYADKK